MAELASTGAVERLRPGAYRALDPRASFGIVHLPDRVVAVGVTQRATEEVVVEEPPDVVGVAVTRVTGTEANGLILIERLPVDDGLRAILNDGTEVEVDPATLRIGPGDIPYCRVKGGAFEARLSRAATFQLLRLADYDEQTGHGVLRLGGLEYALQRSE